MTTQVTSFVKDFLKGEEVNTVVKRNERKKEKKFIVITSESSKRPALPDPFPCLPDPIDIFVALKSLR